MPSCLIDNCYADSNFSPISTGFGNPRHLMCKFQHRTGFRSVPLVSCWRISWWMAKSQNKIERDCGLCGRNITVNISKNERSEMFVNTRLTTTHPRVCTLVLMAWIQANVLCQSWILIPRMQRKDTRFVNLTWLAWSLPGSLHILCSYRLNNFQVTPT